MFNLISFIIFVFLVGALNYLSFTSLVGVDFNFKRYLRLSKFYNTQDAVASVVRVIGILVNITMFIILVATLIKDGNLITELGLKHILMYTIFDLVILIFLYAKEIKQRIDLLSYFRTSIFSITNLFLIFIALFMYAKSPLISQLVLVQNQIGSFYIGWNVYILFPLFLLFALISVSALKDIKNLKKTSEIDVIHNSFYLYSKLLVTTTLAVFLFFGAETSFTLLDVFNLGPNQIQILNKVIFIVKFVFCSSIFKLIFKMKRWDSVFTRVRTSKLQLIAGSIIVFLYYFYRLVYSL